MTRLLVCTGVLCAAHGCGAMSRAFQEPYKAPVVERRRPKSEASTFARPDLIVMVRVTSSCNSEIIDDVDRERPDPLHILRTYFGSMELPVRINSRAQHDPDWSTGELHFRPRTDSADVAVGYRYIVMLDREPDLASGTVYKIAHKQMGFRVQREKDVVRVRPMIAGGELDAYSGLLVAELLKEIQTSK